MQTIADVALNRFEDPVRAALKRYGEIAEGEIRFDVERAPKLTIVAGKPNYARSETDVLHHGEVAGKLFVIAFRPTDGTGDDKTFQLADITTGRYPALPKVVPRLKAAMHTEAHLTLASFAEDQPNTAPYMFAGRLSLLGFGRDQGRLIKLATLGQGARMYEAAVILGQTVDPTVTATVGYTGNDQRFGDPHAVYNDTPEIQVAGFIGITPENAAKHLNVLHLLGMAIPELAA